MESLQLAQMAADLSLLDAADPHAASALVNANKTYRSTGSISSTTTLPVLATSTPASSSAAQQQRIPRSSSAVLPGPVSDPVSPSHLRTAVTGTSTPFETYRRLLTPPITRSSSSHGSLPATPRAEVDADVDRASSLTALYELRAKLKKYNDGNSLRQAREKIAALSARQQGANTPTPSTTAALPSSSPPRSSPPPRRHSQYTYPHN